MFCINFCDYPWPTQLAAGIYLRNEVDSLELNVDGFDNYSWSSRKLAIHKSPEMGSVGLVPVATCTDRVAWDLS
jgi:hypothetical protein